VNVIRVSFSLSSNVQIYIYICLNLEIKFLNIINNIKIKKDQPAENVICNNDNVNNIKIERENVNKIKKVRINIF
jgi:hypothetical protein